MNKQAFLRQLIVWIICFGVIPFTGNFHIRAYGQTVGKDKVKVALIYTVTTPELKEDVVREVQNQLGADVELLTYEVPSVFQEILLAGHVTAAPAARMIGTYMKAVEDGADAILSICSTVGDIAYSAQDVARYVGVPIVQVNDEMCREAVRRGKKIAVMATFPTAIAPTTKTLHRVAREMGKQVEVTEVLVEGGFGLDPDQFRALMASKAKDVAPQVDLILFAQGSMAYCEEYIENLYHKEVLSNPYFSAKALREALEDKGVLSRGE